MSKFRKLVLTLLLILLIEGIAIYLGYKNENTGSDSIKIFNTNSVHVNTFLNYS